MSLSLSQINIYPIKSCRGIEVAVGHIEPRGFRYDRRWMLVDESGVQITQREFPRLTFVDVTVNEDHLRVSAPEMDALIVPVAVNNRELQCVVAWNDEVEAASAGDEAAEWFSDYLGMSCKLVVMTDESWRFIDPKYAIGNDIVSFADAFPFLLISEASLADLNSRLASPVTMKRFRPNLVIKGSRPYEEDSWKEIKIGGVNFQIVKPCARCVIPTVDLDTGVMGPEPLRTLASYRSVENKVLFGQNVLCTMTGFVQAGDAVQVLSYK